MADFTSLKQTIQSYIKQNGNEEITGNILQDVLLAMVSTMGDSAINSLASALQDEITARQNQDGILQGNITAEATARQQADTALGGRIDGLQTVINGINTKLAEGYIYAGIATPSTNPGTPSGKVFYIAVSSGTYTNFSNLTAAQGVNILKYNGSAWSKDVVYAIDTRPKKNSQNPVTSGGVFDNIGALDVSELNATENPHTLAQYADLSAAIAAIPSDYQKGGMSIKYVQSSDNKYVQYRLTSQSFSIIETNWQKQGPEVIISQNHTKGGYDVNIGNDSFNIAAQSEKVDNNSVNLYDKRYFTLSKILNSVGNPVDSETNDISNYIPVNGKNITLVTNIGKYVGLVVYDINKNKLRTITNSSSIYKYTYQYQEGDYYIRANVRKSDFGMANYGDTLLPNEDFNPISGYIDNNKFAFTPSKYFGNFIKELYLPTVDTTKYYYIYSLWINNSTYQFYIGESDTPTPNISSPIIHCFYDSPNKPNGIVSLKKSGNVVGYAVVDIENLKNVANQYGHPLLLNEYIKNVDYSPSIKEKLLSDGMQKTVVVATSSGAGIDFTKITDAIDYANEHPNTTIKVMPGTYDLITELGASYFANLADEFYAGPRTGNNVRIEAVAKNVNIVCRYTGDNNNVRKQFSLINTVGSCSFKGINFYGADVRYVIHDDNPTGNGNYIVHFEDCVFNHEGTTWYDSAQSMPISIGGGCHLNSKHIFENCQFNSLANISPYDCAYHNVGSLAQSSQVRITGCYFKDGKSCKIRVMTAGGSTINYYINGNRFGLNPNIESSDLITGVMFNNTVE